MPLSTVSKRAASVKLVHATQQSAEFSADVESFCADGSAVPQVRHVRRGRGASRLTQSTPHSTDDGGRCCRSAELFQMADNPAETASVTACNEARDKVP